MNWKKNPTHKTAHIAFSTEIRAEVVGGREPKTRLGQAKVEYDTFRRTAEIGVMVDKSLVHQAAGAEASGLFAEHSKAFESVGDWLKDALKGIRRGSSTWSDLSFLAEMLVPYLDKYGIPGKELIYRQGNISKSRITAALLRPLLRRPTAALVSLVQSVMLDLADAKVSRSIFAARYPRRPRASACPAFQVGMYVIVACRDQVDQSRIQSALADRVVWGDKPKAVVRELSLLIK